MANITDANGVVLLSGKDAPPAPGQPYSKYKFNRMKPGDFMFVPEPPLKVQNAARAHARRYPEFVFVPGRSSTKALRVQGFGG